MPGISSPSLNGKNQTVYFNGKKSTPMTVWDVRSIRQVT